MKIGGSLLTRPEAAAALEEWIKVQEGARPEAHRVLIVGGGALVDALRDFDHRHPLRAEVSHWMAIELMEFTARIVAEWIPSWEVEQRWESLVARTGSPGRTLFLPHDFLRNNEPHLPGIRLPVGWQVTSDSIAARVAELLGAQKLILLKSQPLSAGSWREAAMQGFVDSHFPVAAGPLQVVECQTLPSPRKAGDTVGLAGGGTAGGADGHNFNS